MPVGGGPALMSQVGRLRPLDQYDRQVKNCGGVPVALHVRSQAENTDTNEVQMLVRAVSRAAGGAPALVMRLGFDSDTIRTFVYPAPDRYRQHELGRLPMGELERRLQTGTVEWYDDHPRAEIPETSLTNTP